MAAADSYTDLLPISWFARGQPQLPYHEGRPILAAVFDAAQAAAAVHYHRPLPAYVARVAHYNAAPPAEKAELLRALELTEIHPLMYKGHYTGGKYCEPKPCSYTYIDHLRAAEPTAARLGLLLDCAAAEAAAAEAAAAEAAAAEAAAAEAATGAAAPPKPRKKAIPKALKSSVWITYIGKDVGAVPCPCCNVHEITQLAFDCGHIVAEARGGTTTLDNLRPICSKCNKSMQAMSMVEFKKKFFPGQ